MLTILNTPTLNSVSVKRSSDSETVELFTGLAGLNVQLMLGEGIPLALQVREKLLGAMILSSMSMDGSMDGISGGGRRN